MSVEPSAFLLSRIYAQGWKVARQTRLKPAAPKDAASPYAADPERASWQRGFSDGSA